MELKDYRKLLRKIGCKVTSKRYSIGNIVSVVLPSGNTGNVYFKEDKDCLNAIKKIIIDNRIFKITKGGEKYICSFVTDFRSLVIADAAQELNEKGYITTEDLSDGEDILQELKSF